MNAQKLELGLSFNANTCVFNKGTSYFDQYYYSVKLRPGWGLSIPTYFHLSKNWLLKSGIGLHVKEFRFTQDKFDYTNFRLKTFKNKRFNIIEVPLLACLRTHLSKDIATELSTGVIFALSIPSVDKTGFSLKTYDTTLLVFEVTSSEEKWRKTFSPDLYFGISFNKNEAGVVKRQLTISFQYGLIPTEEFTLSTKVSNSGLSKDYLVAVKPQLSTFTITYSFFPRRWKF